MKTSDFLAAVNCFEPIYWFGSDSEKVLRFAEESICGRVDREHAIKECYENYYYSDQLKAKLADLIKDDYKSIIVENIRQTQFYYEAQTEVVLDKYAKKNMDLKAAKAKSAKDNICRIDIKRQELTREEALGLIGIRHIFLQDRTDGVWGRTAHIFTIEKAEEDLGGPSEFNVGPHVLINPVAGFERRVIE